MVLRECRGLPFHIILLRRWSPKENIEIYGKFKRGWIELRGLPFHLWSEIHFQQVLKWRGWVAEIDKRTLKLAGLSKALLRVEMNPYIVLPSLLEVKDGNWIFTVVVSIVERKEGGIQGRLESTHSRDELDTTGGCVQHGFSSSFEDTWRG